MGKKDFARDRMAFSGGGRGISRLLQSLKRNYCKLTANEDWRGGGESIDFIVTQPKSFDHLPPGLSPVHRAALHCCSDASVIWKKNQKQQEAKSEKQQAVAQFFNFLADIPPFGKHWMADDRSEDLNTEELTF